MYVASWCSTCFCLVLCVFMWTGHFVLVPLNLTCLHCLQHSFFEHLFNLYVYPAGTRYLPPWMRSILQSPTKLASIFFTFLMWLKNKIWKEIWKRREFQMDKSRQTLSISCKILNNNSNCCLFCCCFCQHRSCPMTFKTHYNKVMVLRFACRVGINIWFIFSTSYLGTFFYKVCDLMRFSNSLSTCKSLS